MTVSTIFFVDWSITSWSYARSLIRIFCPPAEVTIYVTLLVDFDDAAGADGAATLTDREPQAFFHRDRLPQRDLHLGVITRHHHLRPLRQGDRAGHIRRPEIELRMIIREE